MAIPPVGSSGRQVPVPQAGSENKAQSKRRQRARFFSYSRDKNTTITSVQPPVSVSWSSRIGIKINKAFMLVVGWIQSFLSGTLKIVMAFFSGLLQRVGWIQSFLSGTLKIVMAFFSGLLQSNEDKKAAEDRAFSQGRNTPDDDLRIILREGPIDEDVLREVLKKHLERLDQSTKPANKALLQKIYEEIGRKIRQAQAIAAQKQTMAAQEEQKKEHEGWWGGSLIGGYVNRGGRYIGEGVRHVGRGVKQGANRLVSYLVALSPIEEGEQCLKPDGTNFADDGISEHADLIRVLIKEQNEQKEQVAVKK